MRRKQKQKEIEKKIVISSRSFDTEYEKLEKAGYIVRKHYVKIDEDDLDETVVGIIAGTEPLPEYLLKCAPNLKVISRFGVGTDNIDMDYVKKHNIKIFTTTKHVDAVAEHTITLILSQLKNMKCIDKTQNRMLKGKTVGIIGYGKVGKRVSELVCAFGANSIFYDTANINYTFKKNEGGKTKTLEELLEKSDIITLHCPQTQDTINMIDYEQFALMKKDVIFVNTARARIVNEAALYDFAQDYDHKIALDVCLHPEWFEDIKNVLVTEHEASYTYSTRKEMAEEAIDNLLEGLCQK